MPNLFQVEDELQRIVQAIDDAYEQGQQPPAEALETVRRYAMAAADKRDSMVWFLESLASHALTVEQRIERDKKLLSRIERARERLEGFIVDVLRAKGFKSVSGHSTRMTVVQNVARVDVPLVDLLPASFQRVKTTVEADKIAIKVALQRGEEVPGATLIPGTFRLKISATAPGEVGVAKAESA